MSRRLGVVVAALLVGVSAAIAGPMLAPDPGPGRVDTMPSSTPTDVPAPTVSVTPSTGPQVAVIPRRPPTATVHVARRLQEQLDRLRARDGIPGVSATIIFSDGTTWTGTSGLADVAAGVPVTADTAFSVASVTKTYLAALVLDLVTEGRFGLDDGVAALLPSALLDPRITVRQLLDHTSGVHDFFLAPGIDEALQGARGASWTAAQALGYVGKPYFLPGGGWHYSNTNYVILGLLAEHVTGQALSTELHARLLDPFGLGNTFVQGAEAPRGPVAHGYRFSGADPALPPIDLTDGTTVMPFTSVVTAAGGAGFMAATSPDVARWARLLYRGEVLDGNGLDLMIGDVALVSGFGPSVPYGLGVQAFTIDGRPSVGHSGRFLGSRAAVRYLLDEDVSIAVLTNQSRADPGVIVRALLRIAVPLMGPCRDCPMPG
jgi:D-alanyl-D-alanine carboxypeptidase